jgi:hypothetical protein
VDTLTVEVLYVDGCPNHKALLPRLRALLADADTPAELTVRRIPDDEAAQRERFLGSPSVRVDGLDVDPASHGRTDYGLKCRLYRTTTGVSGQPADELLRAALLRAVGADAEVSDGAHR